MTMSNSAPRSMRSEINVTPMIDVLLVLLILFMVIAPATSKGVSAAVPRPALRNTAMSAPIVLEISKDSQGGAAFRINRQSIARTELRDRLRAIFANRAPRVLFLKAEQDLSFSEIATAIDLGYSAGVERVGLITGMHSPGR